MDGGEQAKQEQGDVTHDGGKMIKSCHYMISNRTMPPAPGSAHMNPGVRLNGSFAWAKG